MKDIMGMSWKTKCLYAVVSVVTILCVVLLIRMGPVAQAGTAEPDLQEAAVCQVG